MAQARTAQTQDGFEVLAPRGGPLEDAVRALNAELSCAGSARRLPAPPPGALDDAERESLSRALMLVLRDTAHPRAFELLYRLNASLVLAFARSRRGYAAADLDPWDVVEDSFLTIHQRRETFRPTATSSFTGWLLVIAENHVRQWLRRRGRAAAVALDAVGPIADDRSRDPALRAATRESDLRIRGSIEFFVRLCAAALLRLPPLWRRALELREDHGLSYQQIAAELGVSLTYAGMLIRRARMRLLRVVGESLNPYRERP